jgi:membrane dipeptidase
MKRVDAHWDTSLFLQENSSLEHLPQAHCDYQRLREYIDSAFFALFFHYDTIPQEQHYTVFNQRLELFLTDIGRPETGVKLLLNAAQVAEDGKFALISAEGGEFLGGEATALQRLEETFSKGLRALGLTWNYNTALAGGCGKGEGGGLTVIGKQVVERCNDLGVLLDAAHLCPESLTDLLHASKKPIIVSHTCCAALGPNWYPRNLADEQLRAVAEKGGVIGIAFVPAFLGGTPGIPRIVEHIRHAVNIAGIDHVGIGSDFDGTELPDDMHGLQDLPLLYDQLQKSGFKSAEVEKIVGSNFCRLLSEVLPG